jgi:hypothetical protein
MLLGLNTKPPEGATLTFICPVVDAGAEGTEAGAVLVVEEEPALLPLLVAGEE